MIHAGESYHVAGVAGVGMNAVAQVLLGLGCQVSGSDRFLDQGRRLSVLDQLDALGVALFPQDGSGVNGSIDGLVISTAVEADNPDRRRAAGLGTPELHRSAVLADAVSRGRAVAVAGTSGKTTCTAMLGWRLLQAGEDGNVVNGGALVNWRSASRIGNVHLAAPEDWWVFEADESDKSLLRFQPEFAMVTTITADHFGLEESIALFREFASQVTECIVCGPGVMPLLEGATTARLLEVDPGPVASLHLPGAHNQLNAVMVDTLLRAMGCTPKGDWTEFRGVERRLERHGSPDAPVAVYDDYGHNPEKIAAAIEAVRPETGRLFAVWRPHGFAPLLNNLESFASMFREKLQPEDRLLLLPVFFAGGTANQDQNSEALQEKVPGAALLPDFGEAVEWLVSRATQGDVILSMGARDPGLPGFARELARCLNS